MREDARAPLASISKKVKIPISTIFERLKTMKDGVIKKNTAIVDFEKLGYKCRANILLKTKREERDNLKEFLQDNSNVNSIYKINNGYDFSIELIFPDLISMEDFLEEIYDKFPIEAQKVYYIVEDIKREAFLSNPKSLRFFLFDK